MSSNTYSTLRVLIVDDFNNFRRTLAKNMYDLGFRHINSVGTGEEALGLCRKQHFDLIISDYNLGNGKNGQQLLEELRAFKHIQEGDVFMMISADTSRNVVMCAYDCEPDVFLTKPINGKALEQRIQRLLDRREELSDVYHAIIKKKHSTAVFLLHEYVEKKSRYTTECQKLLGDIYLKEKEYSLAETLYKGVLDVRVLDWAIVGLANVYIEREEYNEALVLLEDLVESNPSYLKTYDSLSHLYKQQHETLKLQNVLEKAVQISPMSTARQKTFANVALDNGDVELAMKAYKQIMRYGANSHHDTPENHLNFARTVAKVFDNDVDKGKEFSREATILLSNLEDKYEVDSQQKIQAKLLNSQIHALEGNTAQSQRLLSDAQAVLQKMGTLSIDTDIDIVNALIANDRKVEAQTLLVELIERYQGNQPALEKLDPLLSEPVSLRGKQLIARINKRGIESYQSKKYDDSIECFSQAQKKFPRYLGIKMNYAQAMIGFMRDNEVSGEYLDTCRVLFKVIDRYITPQDPQYPRYEQLQVMLRQLVNLYNLGE